MTHDQLLAAICSLSLKQCAELNAALVETLGLAPLSPRVLPPPPVNVVIEGEDLFDVVIESYGTSKLPVIAAVRERTPLSLAEAKALVEAAPVIVAGSLGRVEARELAQRFEAAGATVALRSSR